MAQSRLGPLERHTGMYSARLYNILDGLLVEDSAKRWSIEHLLTVLKDTKSAGEQYRSVYEEIESLKRALQLEMSHTEINSLLSSSTTAQIGVSDAQSSLISRLRDLERQAYG